MKLLLPLFVGLFICIGGNAQTSFGNNYESYPNIPKGILEAVAWTNTHMVHRLNSSESCSGIPQAYGIMGLHENGKDYFLENGRYVAELSGVSIAEQKISAENQINAYAKAFSILMTEEVGTHGNYNSPSAIRNVLHLLSEIPDQGIVNRLARDMQVFAIFDFINSPSNAIQFNFEATPINMIEAFGEANYNVLSSQKIRFEPDGIKSMANDLYVDNSMKSVEFGPAIWNPADPCNYSSRSGTPVSAITIHTIQGTYAGAISWAQNCTSNVSYHYVVRSSDGQVTQMVSEADKAWHVGTENPYTVGYEHEGYVDDPSWYTQELYESSAAISRDIINSGYGIPGVRTYYGESSITTDLLGSCTKIKGHQHYPNQSHTDPGINWNWEKYYRLINNSPTINTLTNVTGDLFDSGGAGGDYQDDERELWLIQPANADFITLNFSVFNIESGYDNLFIYDGDNIEAPLIGSYTGSNSPGTISSTGGSILIEFRSDCATVSNGWEASYTTTLYDITSPTTAIVTSQPWHTSDFTVDFDDQDSQSGVEEKFYLVAEKSTTSNQWSADGSSGFVHESFDENDNNWIPVTGNFLLNGGKYEFTDVNESNSNTYLEVAQVGTNTYLYVWDQTITSNQSNQRAGIHFFCDNPNLPNRGNSYFVYLRESSDEAQIYSVTNDAFTLESSVPFTVNSGESYNCKVIYSPASGNIKLFLNNELVSQWADASPLTTGSFISLRSGGCAVQFDNVKVYASRNNQVIVSAAPSSALMTFESENAIPTGMVESIVKDAAENWSTVDSELYLIDFTPPTIDFLNDGNANDIDTFEVETIESNWLAEDIHSGIANYQVAVGTLPNTSDVVAWTDNSLSTVFSTILANPVYGEVYHVSIRATNDAGLMEQFTSNGQRFINDIGIEELHAELLKISIYPNPSAEFIKFNNAPAKFSVTIVDMNGRVIYDQKITSDSVIDVSTFSQGQYQIVLQKEDAFVVQKLQVR